MWSYVIGSSGLLAGAILALWYKLKLSQLQAVNTGLASDAKILSAEKAQLGENLRAAAARSIAAAASHEARVQRYEVLLRSHAETEDRLRALLLKYGNQPELVAERLNSLFPKDDT